MLLYPSTAASRAFLPSHGERAACALGKTTLDVFSPCSFLQMNRRMTTIIDGNPLKSKTAGQTDGTYGTRGGVAPSPMSEVELMNKESVTSNKHPCPHRHPFRVR